MAAVTGLRAAVTDLVTGSVVCDCLPLAIESMSMHIGSGGELSGRILPSPQSSTYMSLVTPRRNLLWIIAESADPAVPAQAVWAGIIWDTPFASPLAGIPISARTVESLLEYRTLDADYTAGSDSYAAFTYLVNYAKGKTYGGVAQWGSFSTLSVGSAVEYRVLASERRTCLDACNELAELGGFEWSVFPGTDSLGAHGLTTVLGNPNVNSGAPVRQLTYPGELLDYEWPVVGYGSINCVRAVGGTDANGNQLISAATSGLYSAELIVGFPRLDGTTSHPTATSVSQLNSWADADVAKLRGNSVSPTVTLPFPDPLCLAGLGSEPGITLGAPVRVSATSPIHPLTSTGLPGLMASSRIIGWEARPHDQVPTIKLQLGEVTV
jgi:hypothetical protein